MTENPENTDGIISFDEWQKLDLRVAEIVKVEDVEGADKLYKISVDLGKTGKRTICAGLKPYYSKEDLEGKKIIMLVNLAPRKMKGITSEGMLLAAVSRNTEKDEVVLISPEKDIENESKVC